ncbi:MAG TPA: ABC transporter ATP-binding protein [Streptosporangiaceae bacterium]|nr:ABC transporter ATP-binding protein [Streptosporangiaceae bacterium]
MIGRAQGEQGQAAAAADGTGLPAFETTPGPVLEVADLRVTFRSRHGTVYAVQGVSFAVEAGRTLAVIGESGSGKTVSAQAIMGLLPRTAEVDGSIRFKGAQLIGRSANEMRDYRGRNVAMVFQNPERSLNPTMRVGTQIAEAIRCHLPMDRRQAHERAIELLKMVRIPAPERRFHEYPHQLSGGMRQRVVIAIALACGPDVLIADEATTALDVTTQAQIMDLLLDLQQQTGTALLMISHDMGLAATYAEDVVVMYAGKIVERASAKDLFAAVRMPYTQALLEAIPRIELEPHVLLPVVGGRPPDLSVIEPGCPFAPRCPGVQQDCREHAPELREHEPGRWWACWHPCGKGG